MVAPVWGNITEKTMCKGSCSSDLGTSINEFCGIRLDAVKWKAKMVKDEARLREAETKLNEWVVNYVLSKGEDAVIAYDSTTRRGKKKRAKDSAGKYVAIDPQRNLFEESVPRCIINWNSNKQVIPLFEELGFEL